MWNKMFVKDEQLHIDELYFNVGKEEEEIMDLLLNLQALVEMQNPIDMQHIANHQQQDAELLVFHQKNPIQAPMQYINGVNILTMQTNPNQPTLWKIYLPATLVVNVIHWYHVTLGHIGNQKLYNTIRN